MTADLSHPDFPTLCRHLNARGVEYVVFGGWATIAHGLPRTTLDVDLFVRPTHENVERLIDALSEVGHGIARELDADEILARHVFQFADQIRVDIFIRPWGLKDFDDVWARRWAAEFEGFTIPFVSLDDLIRSKETDRKQDREDLEALRNLKAERAKGDPSSGTPGQ
jgi:predicted nucleotidyltransferase